MTFPYRADHVGSLLRPQQLLALARDRVASGSAIRPLEDRLILQILQKQKDLGFKIFTDGEFRRQGFMSDFYESVEGLDEAGSIGRSWQGAAAAAGTGAETVPSYRIPGIVTAKIRQTKRLTAHESAFLKQHSPGDIKITLPTPNQFPAIAFKKGISDRVYPTYSEFLWDLVPIYRSEIQALVHEGVKYIQIDAPRYSYYIDPRWRRYIREEMGVDPDKALDEAIQVDNACLESARREGVIFAMHLCRGNNRSQWYAEGGYDPIAEKLFHRLNVDAFLLEYESERAGTFAPLRFIPPAKTVVLGLISSKVPELEPQDQILRRIDEAAQYVPLENLALSPQCGFASNMEGNLLTEDEQWRKLELVVETARKVWKDA